MRRPLALGLGLVLLALGALELGCSAVPRPRPRLQYEPEAFRTALRQRVPDLPETLVVAPFEVPDEAVELARRRIHAVAHGPPRVEALIGTVMDAPPEGLGLAYDWRSSATARRTLAQRRGNCVALASVLVGLGRGLDWPIYYAEARPRRLETHELEDVTVVLDHMVVVILSKTVRMVVDFTGLVDDQYRIRVIDDLTAYAHLVNNIAGQRIIDAGPEPPAEAWEAALEGFRLATRIQPELGRAWNNQGLALTRLGRFDEAREAYLRAVALDDLFGSAERNLAIMETRATGGAPSLIESEVPEAAVR